MSSPPDMRMWIADYLGDTRNLNTTEHGAYLLLIFAYWENEGALIDDDKRLARIAGMTHKQWMAARPTLEEFFDIGGGRWSHKRIERELELVRTKSEQARDAVNSRRDRSTSVGTSVGTNDQRTINGNSTSSDIRVQSSEKNSGEERAAAASPPAQAGAKGTRLDPNWTLPDEWVELAEAAGIASQRIPTVATKFANYWHAKAGKDATKRDWRATWQNWCLREAESSPALRVVPNEKTKASFPEW